MDDFIQSAAELREGYHARRFSPLDVVRSLARRIEAVNPELNAFTTLALDEAEHTAGECERALMRGDMRPLLGVPIAIKDLIDTRAMRSTYGSAMFAGHVPQSDAEAVDRLRQAGAIIIGKTATHEFAWGFTTDNPHFGPTCNPWDLRCTPGGSSGGSAAAVAAGLVPVALGTDTGGSIRVPSSFCGVAGLKPTYGAISTHGVFPLAPSLDHVGPIARDPGDLLQLFDVLRSHRVSAQACRSTQPAELRGVRIGVARGWAAIQPSADVHAVLTETLGLLRDAGALIVELDDAQLPDVPAAFATIQLAEALHVHRRAGLYPSRKCEYGADVRARLDRAQSVTLEDYLNASARRREIRNAVLSALEGVDVIVSPCAATVAPSFRALRGNGEPPIDLRQLILGYTAVQNLTGLPSCTVRAGFDAQQMPVGLQFTGQIDTERKIVQIAQAFCAITTEIQQRRPPLRSSAS